MAAGEPHVTAASPVDLLRKILELEARKQYRDAAVTGGIDAYVDRVAADLSQTIRAALGPLQGSQRAYRNWSVEQRACWVQSVLAAMDAAATAPAATSRRTALPARTAVTAVVAAETLPATALTRVSTRTAALLARLGVTTIGDLLYLLPRRYLDYTHTRAVADLEPDMEQTVVGRVLKATWVYPGGRRSTEVLFGDKTGTIKLLWFNQPWMVRTLPQDRDIVVSGMVTAFGRRLQFQSPEWEDAASSGIHTGRLVPVYPLTRGLSARAMRKWVDEALRICAPGPLEYMPVDVLRRHPMLPLPEAIRQVHFPESLAHAAAARQRLAFDEILSLQLGLLQTRRRWQHSQPGQALAADARFMDAYLRMLPFQLTAAQHQVLGEILSDLARPVPMSRLLQGDVGSGKTVVALAAMVAAAQHSKQSALMAPTEVLAEQHYRTLLSLLDAAPRSDDCDHQTDSAADATPREEPVQQVAGVLDRPLTVALLTGALTSAQRRRVRQLLSLGEIDIVVGTQALVQEGVEFRALALAVVDEQHRFGVLQRGGLRQKGYNPHVLVMTATPIPRSLALAVYGDLDLSVIDSLPPGRQQVVTRVFNSDEADAVYGQVRAEVNKGRQAFVICPLISESEKMAARAATDEFKYLSHDVFPDLRLGLLHGALRSSQKDAVMRGFRDHEIDILVSTTVIEVGIDVPNATVMVVLGAERFGLSQLHQLRGRVGRGREKSYCLLVSDSVTAEARKRLSAMERTHDGFVLAKYDLEIRGAGDFLGTQQSGLPPLRVATLTDLSMVEAARGEARRIVEQESVLHDPAYRQVLQRASSLWKTEIEWS